MVTISLCMIVKNEEDVIERCLKSIYDAVDEINIIDTGSTDNTVNIAQQYTDRVFNFNWIEDFAAARNYAFQQATKDFILWLDADDVILEKDKHLFMELKKGLSLDTDAVSMNYNLTLDKNGTAITSIKRHRLVKRERQFKWIGKVHEYLEVYGNIKHSDIAITHQPLKESEPNRNLQIYEKMIEQGEEFSPRDLFYYANELVDHQFYEKGIEHYLRFLNTNKGWSQDCINACNKLADCYTHLNIPELAIHWTIQAIIYGPPIPETCCRIGYHFYCKNDFNTAIYWYKQAIANSTNETVYFHNHICSTWLPHLQLAICYDRLGQYDVANYHNEQALEYSPDHPDILSNREHFKKVLNHQ
ncbi:glycosyltransferase [Heyndrickxia ginsengihumi]|uniref:glycosyltransferase n=1 Tax=Heyndrickxia ginsengihumi TaxID=363870 RepID=UPI000470514B|nr:glycosyltransferase [Heyndrickxia ginsengihumi]